MPCTLRVTYYDSRVAGCKLQEVGNGAFVNIRGHVVNQLISTPCMADSCAAPAAAVAPHQPPLALRQWLRPPSLMAEGTCTLPPGSCVGQHTCPPILAVSGQHMHFTYMRCACIPDKVRCMRGIINVGDPLVAMLARFGRHDLEWPPADCEATCACCCYDGAMEQC